MPSQTELSLSSLLPTVSFFPPELVELSNSLLAQSRTKAASLKPEEEVARTYACCHIACERLGNKLALDIGNPRPPVKPRVYDKLKTYFNAVLKTTNARSSAAKRVEQDVGNAGGTRGGRKGAGSLQSTPVKETVQPSSSRKRTASGVLKASKRGREVPKYVMPLIRHLGKKYDVAGAAPHVFAGVSSVLDSDEEGKESTERSRPSQKPSTDEDRSTGDSIGIVTLVFAITYERMYGEDLLKDSTSRDELQSHASDFCRSNSGRFQFDEDMDVTLDYDHFVEHQSSDWREMEWYHNIPEMETNDTVEMDLDRDEDVVTVSRPAKTPLRRKEKHARRPLDDNDYGAAGLLPGLGTMFQPALDWLSDERREHYASWKKDILDEVRILEQEA